MLQNIPILEPGHLHSGYGPPTRHVIVLNPARSNRPAYSSLESIFGAPSIQHVYSLRKQLCTSIELAFLPEESGGGL